MRRQRNKGNRGEIEEIQRKKGRFFQLIDSLCDDFGTFKKECTKIVNDNLDKIKQKFDNNEDPTTICKDISLC